MNLSAVIAKELSVKTSQIETVIKLLDDGSTVPFIARYRKEATGGLDDAQLRLLEERLRYLRELEDRRQTILKSIKDQDKLTEDLEKTILGADNKSALEDLYLPYKPKRRSKALIAREAGLQPLAEDLLNNPTLEPTAEAKKYINPEKAINDEQQALEGARFILLETIAENATILGHFRQYLWNNAQLTASVAKGKEEDGIKFKDYYEYSEAICKIPSHRALALLRGQREEILQLSLVIDNHQKEACIGFIEKEIQFNANNNPADSWLQKIIQDCWRIKIFLKLEVELMMQLREAAEAEAINVFAQNLKHLLMAAPAGTHVTMGLDPGFRTGVKTVVVDATGKLLAHTVIFPHAPQNQWDAALAQLAKLCKQHKVTLISIGNGTASRETDKLSKELIRQHPELKLQSLVVSEAGASVYSASEVAAKEFPDLDVSYRGAISIARRLQDPLAELVKIEPKSIGVGQYQHDVNQSKLSRSLLSVMEDCVNAVGVDLNTASAPLLSCVSGLSKSIASNIIEFRNQHGAFKTRQDIMGVKRMGDKAFEQAVGFLRIPNGSNPLDASAVHPESYPIVESIQTKNHQTIKDIIGNVSFIKKLNPKDYVNDQFGLPTVMDIFAELEKPGRDPRPEFKTAEFNDEVNTMADLKVGMELEGVVTNVANFGAFIDIGVHQDGLVHISMLADHFIKDPNEVVKVGDIVKVKVLEVDVSRKRISLSMRSDDQSNNTKTNRRSSSPKKEKTKQVNGSFGSALMDALKKG